MDFIQHLQTWTKGDLQQGKWMIAIAIFILLPICVLLFKSTNSLQKGATIPLVLLIIMNIGYGSYLLFSKPKYAEERTARFRINNEETIKNEFIKIKVDDKTYTMTTYVWTGLLFVSIICFFVFTKAYFQGMSLGFAMMFLGMLLIDVFLQQRLEKFMSLFQLG